MSISRDGSLIYKHTVVYGLLKLLCDGQNYSHLLQIGLGSFLQRRGGSQRMSRDCWDYSWNPSTLCIELTTISYTENNANTKYEETNHEHTHLYPLTTTEHDTIETKYASQVESSQVEVHPRSAIFRIVTCCPYTEYKEHTRMHLISNSTSIFV